MAINIYFIVLSISIPKKVTNWILKFLFVLFVALWLKGLYLGKPLGNIFFMCQLEDYYMGRNDCEIFTGKIVSTLINYTSIV